MVTCPVCDKTARQPKYLAQHIKAKHGCLCAERLTCGCCTQHQTWHRCALGWPYIIPIHITAGHNG